MLFCSLVSQPSSTYQVIAPRFAAKLLSPTFLRSPRASLQQDKIFRSFIHSTHGNLPHFRCSDEQYPRHSITSPPSPKSTSLPITFKSVLLAHLHPHSSLTSAKVSHLNNPCSSNSRKRKADDDGPSDDRMASYSAANIRSSPAHQRHTPKRTRTQAAGRPLALPRLLETLDSESLRGILQDICTRHPTVAAEVEQSAPRPSVTSALAVLKQYEGTLQVAFPFGGDHTSDYAYNRVRSTLLNLLDALADFVPHFLPPNETQSSQSLNFLDGATEFIHRLPEWQSFQNNLHKQNAYEEISKAWSLAIEEASKRAGGMQLKYEGWEMKVRKHNEAAGGRLQEAVDDLGRAIEWIGGDQPVNRAVGDDISNVRQELLSGTYGSSFPVRVGPW